MQEKDNKSFEEALGRLEDIVRLLENGKTSLEDSLSVFEEGIGLVKYCNEKLTQAEQRVRVLLQGEDGGMQEADFPSRDQA